MAQSNNKGQQRPESGQSDYNSLHFLVSQILSKVNTCLPVKIVAVTNSGGVSPVGFVDVQPLVNQVDGNGKSIPHGIIYHLPYFRVQGGADAIIIDPKVGDIGLAAFASRDISAVKNSKKVSNPSSSRKFDWADGLYFGGFLNGTPTQYIQFSSSGIKLHSSIKITVEAPLVDVNATTFSVNANTVLNGTITQGAGGGGGAANLIGPLTVANNVTGQGTSLHTHVHSGVQSGGSNTGQPTI